MSTHAIPAVSEAGRRLLAATRVVMEHPFFPENVGAAARAMHNCGLSRLVLVDGVDPLHANALKLAVRSEAILQEAHRARGLEEAIAGASLVLGTTRMPYPGMRILTVKEAIPLVVDHARHGEIAWVFGNEKNGLSREALQHCHQVVRIPCVDPQASLNLAQAVMVIAYEVMAAALAVSELPDRVPLTASDFDLLVDRLGEALDRAGFLKPQQGARRVAILRRVLSRIALDPDEAALLFGVARKLTWASEHEA